MNDDFGTAFLLLIVGMITVFSILTLITLFGKWLILIINKYVPPKAAGDGSVRSELRKIESGKLAAIVASVEVITGGRGKISSVKK